MYCRSSLVVSIIGPDEWRNQHEQQDSADTVGGAWVEAVSHYMM